MGWIDANFDKEGSMMEQPNPTLEMELTDKLLFEICMPLIVLGVILNVLALCIWSAVRCGFPSTVYLFKALAVSDSIYLLSFFPARLISFKNYHLKLNFRVLSYGNRTIGVYITLLLAIVRFVKIYFPFQSQRILSLFRVRLVLCLITVLSFSLQSFNSGLDVFLPTKHHLYIKLPLRRGVLISAPAIVQNVLMVVVLCKLWHGTRKIDILNQSHSHDRPSTFVGQTSEFEQTIQNTVVSVPLEHEHKEMVPSVEPLNPQSPSEDETTARTQADTAQFRVKVSGTSPQTGPKRKSAAQASGTTDCGDETNDTAGQEAIPSRQLSTEEQKAIVLSAGFHVQSPKLKAPASPHGPSHMELRLRKVSFKSNTCSQIKLKRKRSSNNERHTTFVVLAMCLSTFVAYPVCSFVDIYVMHACLTCSHDLSKMCVVISIINSSINAILYLSMNRFRRTLLSKVRVFAVKLIPSGLSSTTLTSAKSEGVEGEKRHPDDGNSGPAKELDF